TPRSAGSTRSWRRRRTCSATTTRWPTWSWPPSSPTAPTAAWTLRATPTCSAGCRTSRPGRRTGRCGWPNGSRLPDACLRARGSPAARPEHHADPRTGFPHLGDAVLVGGLHDVAHRQQAAGHQVDGDAVGVVAFG